MAKFNSYTGRKQRVFTAIEREEYGLMKTLRLLQKYAKLGAEEPKSLKNIMAEDGLTIEDFNINLLKSKIPTAFDMFGQLCECKQMSRNEYSKFNAKNVKNGLIFNVTFLDFNTIVVLIPRVKFTPKMLYNIFKKAQKVARENVNNKAKAEKSAKLAAIEAERLRALQAQQRAEQEKEVLIARLQLLEKQNAMLQATVQVEKKTKTKKSSKKAA